MNKVKEFYNEQSKKNEVLTYIKQTLDAQALKAMYAGEPTNQIAKAWETIEKVFHQMVIDFEPKPKKNKKTVR